MNIIVEAHSGLRWLVVIGLVATAIWAFGRGREQLPSWPRWVGGIFIVQIVLGAVLWVVNSGWSQGLFLAVWHPVAMIGALGAFQAGMARAVREERPRALGVFSVIALVLVVLAIPWQRGLM